MADVRTNIFGIGEVYELQREGLWVEKNRESYREFGYFLGIAAPLNRLDYSNDTTTTNIRVAIINQYFSGGAGNSNFGYIMGGNKSGSNTITDIKRIDYSNDTNILSRGGLTIGRSFTGATGNSNFGYIAGGYNNIPAYISTIERINYSNDNTTASIRGPLTIARGVLGTGNSNFGYFGGSGQAPSGGSTVDRIDYSNDSATALSRGNIQNSNFSFSATGNNNFGYFLTGWGTSSSHRLNYANDTALLSIRGSLSFPKFWWPGSAGNSNFGYSVGGSTTSSQGGAVSTIDRIDYSNDLVVASVRGPLSNVDLAIAATSSHSFGGSPVSYLGAPWSSTAPFGYFSGAALGALDRVDYTNDTAATTLRSIIANYSLYPYSVGNQNYSYFSGGFSPGPTYYSTVERIDYSNDNGAASVRGPLSSARYTTKGTGNRNFGYFGGGAGGTSTVDRIDYTNDTSQASVRGSLSIPRSEHSVVGNSNFGYFGGGTPGPISSIDRVDYSNDNVTSTVRSNLNSSVDRLAATGNNNFGYFGGGRTTPSTTNISTVDRIDYSNDTIIPSTRGPLSLTRSGLAATGNNNFGYFGGGRITPALYSTVDRIDYSNDTQVASTRGPLSTARNSITASSSQAFGGAPNTSTDPLPAYIRDATTFDDRNTLDLPFKRVLGSYGYFGGGSLLSTVDRIDYSNDLSTASIRGPLTLNRYQLSATGNSNFGYYIAGNIATPTVLTTIIDRVDYSNDGTIALLRGNTTSGADGRSFGATGNSNFGYIGNWPYVSTTNRIDYSNDNLTASVRGPLSSAKGYAVATGNQNFGYFGGGYSPGPTNWSKVDRIDYSNDLSRSSVRGPLSSAKSNFGATGNSNFGYFGGGGYVVPSSLISTVDRIDYSNDTVTASVRGPLTIAKTFLSATGNSNFGYFGGGLPGPVSTVDRIDYSNDSVTASVRGPLSLARSQLAATTNARSS